MSSRQNIDTTGLGPAGKLLVEKGWTQGTYARNNAGQMRSVFDREAVCFCFVGAIQRAYVGNPKARIKACNKLRAAISQDDIVAWSDNSKRTFEEVIAVFRKAGI